MRVTGVTRRTTSLAFVATLLSASFAAAAAGGVGQRHGSESGATFRVLLRGPGHGTVTSKPRGIACGSVCSRRFEEGATVVLRAAPREGSRFRSWSGDCVGKSSLCRLVVRGSQTVKATFRRRGPFEDVGQVVNTRPVLNVTRAGPAGRVASSPSGIDCPPVQKCSQRFDRGDRVTLRAVAPDGFTFVGWSGLLVDCLGRRPLCSVRMNATTDVTATFTRS